MLAPSAHESRLMPVRRVIVIALLGWSATAFGQQPGPAPIVVRSRGGETTVTQGGEERRLEPSRRDRGFLVARSRGGDSAFDVPETEPVAGGEAVVRADGPGSAEGAAFA